MTLLHIEQKTRKKNPFLLHFALHYQYIRPYISEIGTDKHATMEIDDFQTVHYICCPTLPDGHEMSDVVVASTG